MDLVFATASQLAQMIRNKEVSASEVLEAYLEQINKHNGKVNAIATLDADRAKKVAFEADEALARGENWGRLHGVPISVKDIIETAGLLTTAGYPPLKDYVPSQDATSVARLRAAGAIIFAKTNSAQLGEDCQTNNLIFGQTNNPWDLNRTVGGSSGGSASAIAAGFSPLDLGSDVAGSIRGPAHFCGVYGLMPTDRRVPTKGHIPPLPGNPQYIRHVLRIGPLARSVEDLQLSLTLIAGADDRQPEIPPVPLDYSAGKKLTDCRIAWTIGFDFLPVSKETRSCIQSLINRLSDAGCHLEECNPTNFDWEEALANYGAWSFLELFASTPSVQVLFRGIWIAIKEEFLARTQTTFKSGTPLAAKSSLILPPTLAKYNAILTERDHQMAQMESFLAQWDAWICPVSMTPAFPHCKFGQPIKVDGVKVPYLLAGGYTMPLSLTGNPVVVIPIGQSKEGLPIGVQVVGNRWKDMELLAIAQQINQATSGFQKPPGY